MTLDFGGGREEENKTLLRIRMRVVAPGDLLVGGGLVDTGCALGGLSGHGGW